jgi:hypothetical protein
MSESASRKILSRLMPESEFCDFKHCLLSALQDLAAVRPPDPFQYLARSLLTKLPDSPTLSFEFPEIFPCERPTRRYSNAESPTKLSIYNYPEGFNSQRRGSVVGESFVEEELAESPPLHPKSPEILETIKRMIKNNVLFAHMDEHNLTTVALAMEELKFEEDQIVVKEREEGDSCYFVLSGKLNCFVEERGLVCEYLAGDSFGEASIMYGNLRGATIKVRIRQTITQAQLCRIDRITFKKIVLKSVLPASQAFSEFLRTIEIFSK